MPSEVQDALRAKTVGYGEKFDNLRAVQQTFWIDLAYLAQKEELAGRLSRKDRTKTIDWRQLEEVPDSAPPGFRNSYKLFDLNLSKSLKLYDFVEGVLNKRRREAEASGPAHEGDESPSSVAGAPWSLPTLEEIKSNRQTHAEEMQSLLIWRFNRRNPTTPIPAISRIEMLQRSRKELVQKLRSSAEDFAGALSGVEQLPGGLGHIFYPWLAKPLEVSGYFDQALLEWEKSHPDAYQYASNGLKRLILGLQRQYESVRELREEQEQIQENAKVIKILELLDAHAAKLYQAFEAYERSTIWLEKKLGEQMRIAEGLHEHRHELGLEQPRAHQMSLNGVAAEQRG